MNLAVNVNVGMGRWVVVTMNGRLIKSPIHTSRPPWPRRGRPLKHPFVEARSCRVGFEFPAQTRLSARGLETSGARIS